MLKKVMWVCCLAGLIAATGYFLMGTGTLQAADLTLADAPPGFVWIAGGFYVITALLVFMKKRRITIALAVINVLPLVAFYIMWAGRTDVLFSAPGLITKITQVFLEIGLVYILLKTRPAKKVIAAK